MGYNVDGSKMTSFYLDSEGQIHETVDGKGITTVDAKYASEFAEFLKNNYRNTRYDFENGLKGTGSVAVDKNRINRFLDYLKEKETEETSSSGGYTPSMDFSEYLKTYGGVDTKKQYAENVRQANSDFYRSLMTYGKKAEALAGNGLTSSGVSDYGGAAAYATRQGAVTNAAAIKAQTDTAQASSYAQFLQNEKQAAEAKAQAERDRKLSILNSMYSLGLKSDEEITAYAKTAGYSDEEIADFVPAIQTINNTKADDEYSVNLANATSIYNELRDGGYSHDAAIISLKTQGYTDENILAQLQANYQGVATANTKQSLKESIANPDYSVAVDGYVSKAALDAFVTKGAIIKDSEDYKTMLTDIQEANFASLDNLLKGAHDEGEKGFDLKKACEEFGITYDKVNEETIAESVVKAVRERAQELYYAGDITEEQYKEYIKKDFEYELEGNLEDEFAVREICASLANTFSELTSELSQNNSVMSELYDIVSNLEGGKVGFYVETITNVNSRYGRGNEYTSYLKCNITINGITETQRLRSGALIEYSEADVLKSLNVKNWGNIIVLKDGTVGYTSGTSARKYMAPFIGTQKAKDWTTEMGEAYIALMASLIKNEEK